VKVHHILPYIHEEASGPAYSVPRLAQEQAASGLDVTLACLKPGRPIQGVRVELFSNLGWSTRFAVAPSFPFHLSRWGKEDGIVHVHGLWSFMNVAAGLMIPGTKRKLVLAPRGMLAKSALSHSRGLKKAAWPFQLRALQSADLIHATSAEEVNDIRRAGVSVPVALIPNGVDLPPPQVRSAGVASAPRKLLFLGRLHPIKGIELLLQAWSALEHRFPQWTLEVAGVGTPSYEHDLRTLVRELRLQRVDFLGPLYGEAKQKKYREADLFILPSYSENFGLVVAEALGAGCPAVVTRGAPWEGLEANGCGWWIEQSVESLIHCLETALGSSPEDLAEMGRRGRDWMARDFAWKSISLRMIETYRWLLGGGQTPSTITVG